MWQLDHVTYWWSILLSETWDVYDGDGFDQEYLF